MYAWIHGKQKLNLTKRLMIFDTLMLNSALLQLQSYKETNNVHIIVHTVKKHASGNYRSVL